LAETVPGTPLGGSARCPAERAAHMRPPPRPVPRGHDHHTPLRPRTPVGGASAASGGPGSSPPRLDGRAV